MPKLKTRKSAAARFRITGTGKLVRMKARRNHFRRTKLARVRRSFSRKVAASPADVRDIKRMLPYGVP